VMGYRPGNGAGHRLSLINIDDFSAMVLIIWSDLFWAAFMGLMG